MGTRDSVLLWQQKQKVRTFSLLLTKCHAVENRPAECSACHYFRDGNSVSTDFVPPLPMFEPLHWFSTHQLVIQDKLPELWYKEEGGRDKCLDIPVNLINSKSELVQGRQVVYTDTAGKHPELNLLAIDYNRYH